MRQDSVLLALDRIHESVRMLPARLALCDLEAPGCGDPWFPHCAFVASWLTDCCMALCCLFFAFVLHCHTNPWGDTMLSSLRASSNCPWTEQLSTCRAVLCSCVWFVLFACWCSCFGLFLGFGVCFLYCTVTANGLCIDPIQFSFVSHCHYDQCCYCINSVNLHNAIVFPAC